MSDEAPLEHVEVADETRRYVLGASGGHWGVWDRRSPDEPVAIFPETDEGLDRAERLYQTLRSQDRRATDPYSRPLTILLFILLGIWILARATFSAFYALTVTGGSDFLRTWMFDVVRIAEAVEGTAFALWIGCLVVLVALWLGRNRGIVDRLLGPSGQG